MGWDFLNEWALSVVGKVPLLYGVDKILSVTVSFPENSPLRTSFARTFVPLCPTVVMTTVSPYAVSTTDTDNIKC